MAKSNITVKLFVDWNNERIMTSDELSDYHDELINEMKSDGQFEVWLDENYCASEVWDNADNIEDAWDEHCEEKVGIEIDRLEEVEIDLMPHEYKVASPF